MNEAADLIFEEPRGNGRPSVYLDWLRAASQHPGTWVRWPEPVAQSAQTAVLRLIRVHGLGQWEVITRSIPKSDQRHLYVQFLGPQRRVAPLTITEPGDPLPNKSTWSGQS